jgi:hypothetical protein
MEPMIAHIRDLDLLGVVFPCDGGSASALYGGDLPEAGVFVSRLLLPLGRHLPPWNGIVENAAASAPQSSRLTSPRLCHASQAFSTLGKMGHWESPIK